MDSLFKCVSKFPKLLIKSYSTKCCIMFSLQDWKQGKKNNNQKSLISGKSRQFSAKGGKAAESGELKKDLTHVSSKELCKTMVLFIAFPYCMQFERTKKISNTAMQHLWHIAYPLIKRDSIRPSIHP